jgi:hypothetical protein
MMEMEMFIIFFFKLEKKKIFISSFDTHFFPKITNTDTDYFPVGLLDYWSVSVTFSVFGIVDIV